MAVTATYNGPYTKGYLQYIDLASYHTLVAVPGSTYTIGIASGWEVLAAIPNDGTWTSAVPPSHASFSAVPALAAPGAFFPASPGAGHEDAGPLDLTVDEQWAERAIAAASDFSDIHERLALAGEKIAVLNRGRQP